MNLEALRQERESWYTWKNIKPLRELLATLPKPLHVKITQGDVFTLQCDSFTQEEQATLKDIAWAMRPWRKGPFGFFDTFIDTEWQSHIKYNLLRPHFDLKDKIVGDIGCNNGYYMFRMLEDNPKRLVGFDPSALYKTQFDLIEHYAKSGIIFEMLGVEHLPFYEHTFDVLFCLGVLYHRSDPVGTLKALAKSLHSGGELILDTFMIEGDEPHALCPGKTYSKIPNIYFIPTINALRNWGEKAGFKSMDVLEMKPTDTTEQRKTEWIEGQSLGDFLDPTNPHLTIEGYPAPKRLYVKFYR